MSEAGASLLRSLALSIAIVLAVATTRASAQSSDGGSQSWSAKAEGTFVAATGNSATRTLGLGGEFEHQPDGRDTVLRVNYVRSADRGDTQAESLTALSRVSQRLSPRGEAYGEADYLRNRFAGIDNRYNIDAGLSYRLLAPPRSHLLRIFAGMGYLHESHPTSPRRSTAAAHGGLRYRWLLHDRGEIIDELQLTDTLTERRDWRAAQVLSISSGLSSFISLKVSQRIEYQHTPGPGFRSTDTLTSAALVLKF